MRFLVFLFTLNSWIGRHQFFMRWVLIFSPFTWRDSSCIKAKAVSWDLVEVVRENFFMSAYDSIWQRPAMPIILKSPEVLTHSVALAHALIAASVHDTCVAFQVVQVALENLMACHLFYVHSEHCRYAPWATSRLFSLEFLSREDHILVSKSWTCGLGVATSVSIPPIYLPYVIRCEMGKPLGPHVPSKTLD